MRAWFVGFGVLIAVALSAGMIYKLFFSTTNKTVIGRGGKQVIINTESPRIPVFNFGCSNLQAEMYWRKGPRFNLDGDIKRNAI